MRRYRFLKKEEVYDALNRLRDAFLAARDGHDVDKIIKAVLTQDERMKIGRRILIAKLLSLGYTFDSIRKILKVGKSTVAQVEKNLSLNPAGFELINNRTKKVKSIYKRKSNRKLGSSKIIFKKKEYTGFSKKDVRR